MRETERQERERETDRQNRNGKDEIGMDEERQTHGEKERQR